MFKRLLMLLLLAGLLMITTNICLAEDTDNSIKVYKLPDGHTVVIKEVHTNPIVTVDTWIRTGSINETEKNNGVSHFLEHLLFKGTKNHKAGEADRILESKGAVYNAATSNDFTHFYTTINSQYAETALNLQADMLLNAIFPEDELNRERKVVQEEIHRAKDSPDHILYDNLNGLLFKTHPYKYDTLGTEEMIQNIPREDILSYYHKWYVPSNMITVIVGDVNTDKILDLVKKYYKPGPDRTTVQNKYPREPYITAPAEKVATGNYNSGYMAIAYKGVPIWDKKDNYALDLAAAILGGGRSSRLYQTIKIQDNLVNSISASHESMRDDSLFDIDADVCPDKYIPAKEAIIKEIDRLRDGGVTQEELKRVKTQLQRAFLYNSESVQNIANAIGNNMVIGGSIDYYTKYIENVNKITAQDIQEAMKKCLPDSRRAISVLLPDSTPVSCNKAQESYKNVTKTVLNNGITLITDKNASNEIVSLSVLVKGGHLTETKPGTSDLVASTLLKGTINRSEIQIANELENFGIEISPASGSDYFEIQLKSTRADFDRAFNLLSDIINNPAFKNEDIQKAKADILEDIRESRDNPSSYAFEKFTRAMYPNHPYGNEGEALEKSLPGITRDDMVSYYKKYFVPQNMVVSVSGNVDNNDLINKFYLYFPQTDGKTVDLNALTTKFSPEKHNEVVSVKKDTSAAWLLMGWPVTGITQDKDFATLKVTGAILGGGLSSRLFVDLREKQGLAYTVSTSYPTKLDNSFFVLYIGTKPGNEVTVENGFINEINRIKTEPVSNKELGEAKQKLIGQLALAQETNQDKAHLLGAYETLGKGYKFIYNYPDLINSVTSDDIIRVANKYFNNPYIISIVAPAKNVERVEKEFSK